MDSAVIVKNMSGMVVDINVTINGKTYNRYDIMHMDAVTGMDSPVRCYTAESTIMQQFSSPLNYSIPLLILQIMLIIFTTRVLGVILKYLRQPKIISEILGGVLLGPMCLGRIPKFTEKVFPLRCFTVLDMMAKVGLHFFLFLVGVEIDITMLKRTSRQALIIGAFSTLGPFIIGYSLGRLEDMSYLVTLSVGISASSFPVLARILTELKILDTEVGRICMSAALVNDIAAWILLPIGLAIDQQQTKDIKYVFLCYVSFVLFCFLVIRPLIKWIVDRNPRRQKFNDLYILLIVAGVMISSFITDFTGPHSIFGAFVFGLIIPNGPLGTAVLEKLEDFVNVLLLPLFFVISGLRTFIPDYSTQSPLSFIVVFLCSIQKFLSTVILSRFYNMAGRDALSMGLLMNTKGIMEMITLNVAKDNGIFTNDVFAVMVIFIVSSTAITTPMIIAINKKPYKRFKYGKKYRTLQRLKVGMDLRILICVHNARNVPTIINLLEASNPSKNSFVYVYALHLVELSARASSMLIVHNARRSGHSAINSVQDQSECIINAFEKYAETMENASLQPLTAISSYSTMHEDICNIAEEKLATLIIVPFHKQQTIDGKMEVSNPAFRDINQNVLANSPCSVGILIDRGLPGFTHVPGSNISQQIAMLFFGGPDDREALAYAWRMAENPSVYLTVLRFLPGDESMKPIVQLKHDKSPIVIIDDEREKLFDDEYIGDFKQKSSTDETILYKENVVNNGEETIASIRSLKNAHDLYIVGRGYSVVNPLTSGLTDYSECPELGAIGDLLASSDFGTTSILVVQQYTGDGMGAPGSPADHSNHHFSECEMPN